MANGSALLGAYIRRVREARGWSLRELGDAAGVTHTTVDNIEKGYDPRTGKETNTTLDTLIKIARALGEEPAHLLACLDGTARVYLRRPLSDWYPDELEDMEHARGGVREYLRLKWGGGHLEFPPAREGDTEEAVAKRYLFGAGEQVSDEEWDKVKTFVAFLKQSRP